MKKLFVAIVLALGLLCLSACAGVSTTGVHTISTDPGLVALPQGDTLVMKQHSGKNARYWYLTYDGEILKLHTDALFTDDKSVTLEGEKHLTIDFGWSSDDLTVWTDREVVYVQFPDGTFDTWSTRF